MNDFASRRHLLAAGVAGAASLAGCQSVLASDLSVTVHVLNSTEQKQDAYVEITDVADENNRAGQVLPINSGVAKKVHFSVSAGKYEMLINLDDIDPRPEKTVEWEITDKECSRERYCVIKQPETHPTLQIMDRMCGD